MGNLIRAGNVPLRAALARGVPRSTWYSWLARGRRAALRRKDELEVDASDLPFLELLDAVERAESESQVIAISHLQKSMPTTPTAVLSWLERRFPTEWSRTERHELSGEGGGPVQIEDYRLRLSERAERIAARLLEAVGRSALPSDGEP